MCGHPTCVQAVGLGSVHMHNICQEAETHSNQCCLSHTANELQWGLLNSWQQWLGVGHGLGWSRCLGPKVCCQCLNELCQPSCDKALVPSVGTPLLLLQPGIQQRQCAWLPAMLNHPFCIACSAVEVLSCSYTSEHVSCCIVAGGLEQAKVHCTQTDARCTGRAPGWTGESRCECRAKRSCQRC